MNLGGNTEIFNDLDQLFYKKQIMVPEIRF